MTTPCLADSGSGEPVKVQLRWLHQFQFAGYYAALENGYYREAGLDVTLLEGGPGRNPIEEVVSGRAQYGAASSEVLLARLRGKPVKVLAVIFQQSPSIFLARKISGINSPQDMLGQRVMMMPGMDDAELLAMFLKEGVKLEKVHRIPTSFNVEDLINGKADVFNAYLTNEPYYLEQRGMPAAIIRPSTYGIHFYGDSLFTSEEEVKNHPDRVKAFRQATLRGWQYAVDHSEEIIELILAKYPTKKTREHLRYEAAAMRELLQPEMIEMGHMNMGRWRHMAETFAELGLVDKRFKLDGLTYDPDRERDLTPILWMAGVGGVILLVVGLVALALARFNLRLRREVGERARAEQRFATMASNVPGAIIQILRKADGSRRYTYLSARAKEFFGVEPEVVIREGRTLNWHPEDRGRIERQIGANNAAGVGHNLVGRVILPDGEEKWVNLTASPSPLEDGDFLYDGFLLDVTERKLAEMEYLASERKIKAMSGAVDDALIMLDSQGSVLFWNPAAERLFGYTADEAMGMDFHSMAAPQQHRDKARQGLEEFARNGHGPVLGTTTEIEATDRQGRVFPVEVTLSSFQVDNEWFAVGTVRDISARKQAEEALQQERKRLQGILDTSPVGVGISRDGVICFANSRYTELVRARVGERAAQIYVNAQDRERMVQALSQADFVPEMSVRMYGPNGEIRDILATFMKTEYEGKPGILGWLVDITELKRAEEAAKESQQRTATIIDFLPIPTLVIDREGRVVSWNRSIERLTGVSKEDILGRGDYEYALPFYGERRPVLVDLVSKWDEELAAKYLHISKEGDRLVSESFHPNLGDGGVFLSGTATLLYDAAGQVAGAIETLRDITERKKAEALMVEKNVAEEAATRAEAARQEAEKARQEAEAARQWAEVAQEELKAKVKEIERFNRLAMGREQRIIELKRQANTLASLAGFQKPYSEHETETVEEVAPAGEEVRSREGKAVELDADRLAEILAVDQFQTILQDFCEAAGIAAAIIDIQGKVLAAARWQRACTDFHRQNEATCARCIESDTELAAQLSEGKPYTIYSCKNGLTDAASPIIVDGKHLANVFVGQFFISRPDTAFFLNQAMEMGFDHTEYATAIAEVPVVREERLPSILGFLVAISRMVADSYSERQRALMAEEAMARKADESLRERAAALSLAEDAEEARAEIEQYKGRLELLVEERTEELKATEERSRLLLHSVGEGIFGVDAQGRMTFINPAALNMLGFEETELMGSAVHALIHHTRSDGSHYPVEECPMHASFTDGTVHHVDDEVLWRKDGASFPVEYSSTPISKDGRLVGAVITFRDITERQAAQQALTKERTLFLDILEKSPISIAITTGGIIRFVNPIVYEKFGFTVGDPAPKVYVREADRDALIEILRREGIVKNREVQMWSIDRRKLDMLVTYVPISFEGESGVLAWLIDISERKQAEEEMRQYTEDLERFNRLTLGREERMIELKEEINGLLEKTGLGKKYKIVDETELQ